MTTKQRRQQIFEMVAVPTDHPATLTALRRGLSEKGEEIMTVRNEQGQSLLRSAIQAQMDSKKGGNWEVIRLLLELGADANLRWMDPVRVEYCKQLSDRKIVYEGEILIDYVISRAHNTPGSFELLRLLVDVGKADCTLLRHDGKSVLKTAVMGNNWEIAKWLLFEVSTVDLESFSIVCARGQWSLARLFIDKGMEITSRCDYSGYQSLTALHCACLGKRNVAGEDNIHQKKENNPIEMMGQVEVVKGLLDCPGIDPNAVDSMGRTCLHLIAVEVAEYDENDKIDQEDAVGKGKFLMMGMLLKAGANPDAQDHEGNTPLHEFARKGDEGAVMQLLAAGADSSIQNKQEQSACDVAHINVYKAMGLQTAGETFVEALLLPMSVAVSPFRFGVNWALKSREAAAAEEEKQLKLIISPLRKAAGVVTSPTPTRPSKKLSPAATRSSLVSGESPMIGIHGGGGTDQHSVHNDSDADGETARSTITGTDLGVPSEVCGERSERDEAEPSSTPQQQQQQQSPQQPPPPERTTKTELTPASSNKPLVSSSSHSNVSDLKDDLKDDVNHLTVAHTSSPEHTSTLPSSSSSSTAVITTPITPTKVHMEIDKIVEDDLKFSSNPLPIKSPSGDALTVNMGGTQATVASSSPTPPTNSIPVVEKEHKDEIVSIEKTVLPVSPPSVSALSTPFVIEEATFVLPPAKPSTSSSSNNKKKKRK